MARAPVRRQPRAGAPAIPMLAVLWLLGFALASPPAAGAASLEVEAGFEVGAVGVDETVGFWIEVRSGHTTPPRFDADFELDNLERTSGQPSRSSSFRFVNGVTSRTLRLTWPVRPLSSGEAAVRDIRVTVGGEVFELPTERLEVRDHPPPRRSWRNRSPRSSPGRRNAGPPDLSSRSRRLRNGDVFLRAEAEPRSPYVGQQVVYVLYLYTRADISAIYPSSVPSFRGFWAQEIPLPQPSSPEMVEIDGERFGRVPLLKRVLFPHRPGVFELEPAEYDLVAQLRTATRLGTVLDRPHQLRRRSEPVRLVVRELPTAPENLEGDFRGAVGSFEMKARLEPERAVAGEAVTLTLELAGDGHLQSMPAPQMPSLAGLEVHPPETTSREEMRSGVLWSERSWRWVLVPGQPGRWQLDAFELPYFDPRAGGYRLASSGPLTLVAESARRHTAEAGPAGTGADLHPIRSAAVPVDGRSPLPGLGSPRGALERSLPWLAGVPLALVLLLRLAGRRRPMPETERLLEALEAVERQGDDDGPAQARRRRTAVAVEEAWGRYLADRWQLPPDLPATRWGDTLAGRPAMDPAVVEAFRELADEVHYLRYSPQLTTLGTLRRELLERSRRLARRLD